MMTRSFKPGVQVTMVVQPLKHKCCRRRRVKFIVHNRDSRRVISLLLMLAGDVEINPGPSGIVIKAVLPYSLNCCNVLMSIFPQKGLI